MERWSEQMRDRFMVAEIAIDEMATVADSFPDLFSPKERLALSVLQRNAFQGFAPESLMSRRERMQRICDDLQSTFPCARRTDGEESSCRLDATMTDLASFIADNADAIREDPDWLLTIVASLRDGHEYSQPAGAAAGFAVRLITAGRIEVAPCP